MLPAPNASKRARRRWRGPIAPTRTMPFPSGVDRRRPRAPELVAQHRQTSYGDSFARWRTACAADPHRSALRLPAGRRRLFARRVAARPRRGRRDRAARPRRSSSSSDHARGLPVGIGARGRARRFAELDDEASLAIIGPSISDNALIAAPLCDAAPRSPRSTTPAASAPRSQWMFHYQVGSLEEEPPVLAARMVERGLAPRRGRVRPVARRPPLRRVLRSRTRSARARGHRAPRASRRSPRTPSDLLARLRRRQARRARVLRSRRRVAGGRRSRGWTLGWDVPVLAELGADVRLRAARLARRLRGLGVHRHHRRRQPAARRAARAFAARRRRPDRLRGLRHGPPARRSGRPGRAPDPRRHRRRPAAREAAPRDERLRRHADGLRDVRPRRAQGPLPRASRVEGRPQRAGRPRASRYVVSPPVMVAP